MAMNIGGLIATVVPWTTNKHRSNVNDLRSVHTNLHCRQSRLIVLFCFLPLHRSFKVPLYIAIAMPAGTLIAELFLLVESPYCLMLRSRKEDAKKSLRFINLKCSEEELDLPLNL
jgi:hypothetical protein